MKKTLFVIVLVAVLAMALSACSSSSDLQVLDGDVAACEALLGSDVSAWEFTAAQKVANNVCYAYQQQQ